VSSVILLILLRALSTPSVSPLGRLLYQSSNVEFLLMFQKEVAEVKTQNCEFNPVENHCSAWPLPA
jgi:hypothetical protein